MLFILIDKYSIDNIIGCWYVSDLFVISKKHPESCFNVARNWLEQNCNMKHKKSCSKGFSVVVSPSIGNNLTRAWNLALALHQDEL